MDKQTKLILALFVFVVGLLAFNVGRKAGRDHGFAEGWNAGYIRGQENIQNKQAWQDGFSACQEQF